MASKSFFLRPDGDFNIPRTVHDAGHRYHMNPLSTHIESKGNGVKTCVSNLATVAQSLERDVQYLAQHISNELGVSCVHLKETGKWLFTGRHSPEIVALKVDSFIAHFVLCSKCHNPETGVVIEKGDSITLDCRACGHVTKVDARFRLYSFVLKHPPGTKEEKYPDTSLSEDLGALTVEDLEFAENWTESNKSEPEAPLDPIDGLSLFLLASPKPKKADILDRVKALALQFGWKKQACLAAVFGALFGKDMAARIKEHASTLRLFVKGEQDQLRILTLMEKGCSIDATATSKVNFILQQLYEQDVIEERAVIKWSMTLPKQGDEQVAKALRDKAAPFLTWLSTADAEDEE